jgi:hypothetical protein
MKTRILSIIALIVLGFTATIPANAAIAATKDYTILNDVNHINKIEVYGNVQVYVSDGSADQVKVYNNYYAEDALVQNKNGVLRISSYKAEKLVVWVTAADLRAISAYDNSEVKSFGSLSKIDFDVELHNNASAKLNLDAFSATVTLTDHAKADLAGNADQFNLNYNVSSSVNKSGFSATHYTENKIGTSAEVKAGELVVI